MKAKLIKKKDGWYNLYQDNIGIGSTHSELQGHKLSLKNCQAIEGGYDLDELAYSYFPNGTYETSEIDLGLDMYKKGFQKALELLGDKKYSEDNLLQAIEMYHGEGKTLIEIIKSLQHVEWDVEIEMECREVKQCECSSNKNCLNPQPKLDATGCLILKRINL
jgi:hypothetical protein